MDRPFVYLFCGLFMGIASCILYVYHNIITSVILSLLFLGVLIKTLDKRVTYVILCYFILGIISFNLYFNFSAPDNTIQSRIVEDKGYYFIGDFNGRKIKVIDTKEKFQLGRRYVLQGDFEEIADYRRGIIGNFKVKGFEEMDVDFISNTYKLKRELFKKYSEKLGRYNTSVLMGVCYGDSSYLSYDEMEAFNVLGISHVISVSGLHTSLIYGAISVILGYKLSIIVLFLYVVFTGAKSATMRAFIMIVTLVLSKKLKKNHDSISALSFAAFLLLLIKPYYILDVGYSLSFLGMLGLYLLYKPIRRKFYKLPRFLNESISLTFAATFFTMPYIIFIFKTFSLGGLIANLIIIPFYTFVVIIGNIALVIHKVQPVFNICTNMLVSIFSIINISQKFLIDILPVPLKLSYMEGLAVIMLYPTYMLVKRGHRALLYMPIALCVLIGVNQYKFTPEVSYINGGAFNIISVHYKNKRILLSPQRVKLSKVYEPITVQEIYDDFEKEVEIQLDDKYKIKGIKENKDIVLKMFNKNHYVSFMVCNKEEKIEEDLVKESKDMEVMRREEISELQDEEKHEDKEPFYSEYSLPYDIIRVVKDKELNPKGRYFKSFKIINGKAFETYIH
ncbi:ComEC/Rec2 family competence protein [Clostridium sp. UBA4548]|uniref:ComEC/Rec2 family competence protein n=1 Tax=Clostridium sp. UBA4548 TaxID=1946361 RepID=UPI0025BC2214|nr:ComEC/Rec2 family competence protein [Clostridium sp. UBA4548]